MLGVKDRSIGAACANSGSPRTNFCLLATGLSVGKR